MGKILIVSGARNWSMDTVIKGVLKHTKHDVEMTNYWIKGYTPKNWDAIYIHCGAVMSGEKKQYILDHRDDTKWAVGIRGPTAYKRNVVRLNSKLWDAYSCGSHVWVDRVKAGSKTLDVEGYVCHGGVDVEAFIPQPLPSEFTLGWAGNIGNGAKRFKRFYDLPFKRKAVGAGFKFTDKWDTKPDIEFVPRLKYDEMTNFYAGISVYVNTSYREGGPLPTKEAAASGRVVVSTRCGDSPEWIPEEYLVDTEKIGYDEKNMIRIIDWLKDDEDMLEREGRRFKELSERWDFSVVAKEYDKMFDGMLNE